LWIPLGLFESIDTGTVIDLPGPALFALLIYLFRACLSGTPLERRRLLLVNQRWTLTLDRRPEAQTAQRKEQATKHQCTIQGIDPDTRIDQA